MHVTGGWAEGRTCLGTQARADVCLVAQSMQPEKRSGRRSRRCFIVRRGWRTDILMQAFRNATVHSKKGDQ